MFSYFFPMAKTNFLAKEGPRPNGPALNTQLLPSQNNIILLNKNRVFNERCQYFRDCEVQDGSQHENAIL